LNPAMKKNRTTTAGKLDDPISRKAWRDAIKPLFDKHFARWTPTECKKALLKIATSLEMAAQGIRDLLKSEYLQR
jgi:hypothetical protein